MDNWKTLCALGYEFDRNRPYNAVNNYPYCYSYPFQELTQEEVKERETLLRKLKEELRNEEMKLVLLKKLRHSQQVKENVQTAAPAPPPSHQNNSGNSTNNHHVRSSSEDHKRESSNHHQQHHNNGPSDPPPSRHHGRSSSSAMNNALSLTKQQQQVLASLPPGLAPPLNLTALGMSGLFGNPQLAQLTNLTMPNSMGHSKSSSGSKSSKVPSLLKGVRVRL